MLTLQEIITEADVLVPNGVATAEKVVALNAINQDFFNTVKIPKLAQFISVANQTTYALPADVRSKNIDLVMVGMLLYRSLDMEAVLPLQNLYSFDDASHVLTLHMPPYQSGLSGICRYRRLATTTFSSGVLSAIPDAPEEHQWTYIPALAAWIANAQDDMGKGSNYEAQYRAAWNTASQAYAGGGVT